MSFLTPPFILSILIALTVHECAHGLVAYWLGDPTAKNEGRLTLNPIPHLDLFGSLMFIIIGFGWAKPVPVDPRYFKNPKRDMTLTALAGPASNLLLAILTAAIGGFILRSGVTAPEGVARFSMEFFQSMLWLNLGLMAFNLLPVAPLDGSKIIGIFIPYRYEYEYQAYLQRGPFILLGLLIAERVFNIPLLVGWITFIINPLLRVIETLLA